MSTKKLPRPNEKAPTDKSFSGIASRYAASVFDKTFPTLGKIIDFTESAIKGRPATVTRNKNINTNPGDIEKINVLLQKSSDNINTQNEILHKIILNLDKKQKSIGPVSTLKTGKFLEDIIKGIKDVVKIRSLSDASKIFKRITRPSSVELPKYIQTKTGKWKENKPNGRFASRKEIDEAGLEWASKPIQKTEKELSEIVSKSIDKKLGKDISKVTSKKIPIVGLIISGVFAGGRLASGDVIGAGMELGSGVASLVPGVGTGLSLSIDASIIARDVYYELYPDDSEIDPDKMSDIAKTVYTETKKYINSRIFDKNLYQATEYNQGTGLPGLPEDYITANPENTNEENDITPEYNNLSESFVNKQGQMHALQKSIEVLNGKLLKDPDNKYIKTQIETMSKELIHLAEASGKVVLRIGNLENDNKNVSLQKTHEHDQIIFDADIIRFQAEEVSSLGNKVYVKSGSLTSSFRKAGYTSGGGGSSSNIQGLIPGSIGASSDISPGGMVGGNTNVGGGIPGGASLNREVSKQEIGTAQQVIKYFTDQGWSAEQAAGIAANIQAESNFNTSDVGDGGAAYGLAQWHPDRQEIFKKVFGKDIRQSSFNEQLAYIQYELTQGQETRAGSALRAQQTPEDSALIVDSMYERSSGSTTRARMELAKVYNMNNESASPVIQTETSLSDASTQSEAAGNKAETNSGKDIVIVNNTSSSDSSASSKVLPGPRATDPDIRSRFQQTFNR